MQGADDVRGAEAATPTGRFEQKRRTRAAIVAAATRLMSEGKAATGYLIDNYLDSRAEWESWNGILIRNWHRPFHLYMQALLQNGLRLVHFDEPAPQGGDPQTVARYRRAPWLHVMEWVRG